MFKNYLKIAWRNLWKNKGYSSLNIFGLAIAITCASLILLWVEDEVSFDSVFTKKENVYVVLANSEFDGEWRTFGDTPGPLAQDLKDEMPEIVKTARTSDGNMLFTIGDNSVNRSGTYVDADFLDILSLQFVEGNIESALDRPDAIVLTQKTASDLFGKNTTALNKTLRVNNNNNYVVTGVVKDLPDNTTLGFGWLAPFERFNEGEDNEWMKEYGNNFAYTFVELALGSNYKAVDTKLRELLPEKMEDPDSYFFLHPMKDWHLRNNFENGEKVGGQIVFVRLMAIIALIILLIACINFMNLATARSEKRAKEVGLRKVLGSGKKMLISQFMAEALITAALATVVSVFFLSMLLPQFNILIEKQLELRLFDARHLLSLLSISLICGLLAGWYPAFYLSSFKPAEALKGVKSKQGNSGIIRKGLVVAQFAVSIVFIISTIIVYQQIQHVKSRDLGFAKENLIKIPVKGDMLKNFDPIKNEIIASGMVENVALLNTHILADGYNGTNLEWQGGTDTKDVLISFRYISSDFFKTAGMEIIEGRGFSEDASKDSTNTLISQSFAKLMGEGSALGKTVIRYGKTYTVLGVVKDYLYGDMYGTSDPVMFFNDPSWAQYLYIKTKSGTAMTTALTVMEKVIKTHNPAFPFEYEFVDDSFNSRFKSEKMMGSLSQIFAILAIVISCLGLFGLSAYTAEQRRKEIGVRKVLGSSVMGIVKLLSKDFLSLVLIALLVAGPLAWWAMKNWLEGFNYRIEINPWVFAFAGLIAIGIALLTVSFQAVKAALANPVKSLRTE
ncbi:ABC transporter permease [Maribacter halichondriae]|uniref:ABC transporter permease n=1 Tax=Maribacter halichondriae TaxID=2980554 RepID=UPI002358B1AF|nr:ABC transporter permease [Maribacter sp. Hal144]